MASEFTEAVCGLLLSVPIGRVVTYGSLAKAAGQVRGARQVVRILHSQSSKRDLPWHRVVNAKGMIALSDVGMKYQRHLLEDEGVEFDSLDRIDLKRFLWVFSPIDKA